MKKLSIALITLGLATSLFAAQNNKINPQEIEKQISEIQQLPLKERVAKMNEIKEELRHMNEQEREMVIREIAHAHHIENNEMESNFNKKHNKHQNNFKHEAKDHYTNHGMNDHMDHVRDFDTEHEIEHHKIKDSGTHRAKRNDRNNNHDNERDR